VDDDEPVEIPVRAAEAIETEAERVESWRMYVLIEAGYPIGLAASVASSSADLHRAVRLLQQGCTPELAADILT
jgi:hypothetical protein